MNGKYVLELVTWVILNFLVKVDITWIQDPGVFPQVFKNISNQYIQYYLQDKSSTLMIYSLVINF